MQIAYRILFEVEIRHDYFLLNAVATTYTTDYDIRNIFLIVPSEETAAVMRDHKMIFRNTAKGFVVLVSAELVTAPNVFATIIDFSSDMCFSFYWQLLDPYFENYTNRRLIEKGKQVYYFGNREGSVANTIPYLNNAIAPFGTTYLGEPLYRHGDIISETGQTFEMIDKDAPTGVFAPAKWQLINTSVINYVNPGTRITWQPPRFEYKKPNTIPGEMIMANLFDTNNQPVDLGTIPLTNQPQNTYQCSFSTLDPVNFVMDLSAFSAGKYRMDIVESSGTTSQRFYLLDPMINPDLYGVSEFFVAAPLAAFRFITEDPVSHRWILDTTPKKFQIRFRNRLTRWQYLKQDQTIFDQPPTPRPLTKIYSGYNIPGPGGSTIHLPDPAVNTIIPDVEATTRLVKNIFSKIFLNK
jgi:hypothetical protein